MYLLLPHSGKRFDLDQGAGCFYILVFYSVMARKNVTKVVMTMVSGFRDLLN